LPATPVSVIAALSTPLGRIRRHNPSREACRMPAASRAGPIAYRSVP
jgi:hypothetical protein